MTRLHVVKVLKGYIQFLAKIYQSVNCLDKKGNMAWNLVIGKVCPLHQQRVRKLKDDDKSSSHISSNFCLFKKSTIRHPETNLLQEISMGS